MIIGFRKLHSTRGVTIIEFVIFFPLFLVGIMMVVWLGAMANAKYSLVSALANAVRLAGTRGDPSIYGSVTGGTFAGAIAELDNFHSGGALTRKELLYTQPDDLHCYYTGGACFSQFNKNYPGISVIDDGDGNTDSTLPAQFLYVVAYTAQALVQSVGGGIRYPCDPRNTDGSDPQNGANCLLCRPVHPNSLRDEPYTESNTMERLRNRIAVRCDFKPVSALTRPIAALFGIITRATFGQSDFGVISYGVYYDKQDVCFRDGDDNPYCIK